MKQRQIERILELLKPLQVENVVRTLQEVTRPVALAPTLPAIQLVVGPEDVNTEEEDTQGYLIEYVVGITVIDSSPKTEDRINKVRTLTAAIQAAIEGDIQLAPSLARSVSYQGDDPFYSESDKPICGNTLTYLVQYRRRRAVPSAIY